MIGNQGTPSAHTCGQYQEVIDAIRDTEPSMIVIAENRLLANEPIEFLAWEKIKSQAKKMNDDKNESFSRKLELDNQSKRLAEYVVELKEEMYDAERLLEDVRRVIEINKDKLLLIKESISEEESKVSIGGVSISMNSSELKSLIKAKIQLNALENGGVDNWEWYGESLLSDEELENAVKNEISSIKITGLGGQF
jgi:hypothetical protein